MGSDMLYFTLPFLRFLFRLLQINCKHCTKRVVYVHKLDIQLYRLTGQYFSYFVVNNVFVWFQILEDWRYIAMVIDRLQLYIFLAVTIGGTIGILISAPHIFTYVDQDKIKQKIIGNGD